MGDPFGFDLFTYFLQTSPPDVLRPVREVRLRLSSLGKPKNRLTRAE
jgi:hypothetical protein